MIIIHATMTEAVERTSSLDTLMETFRTVLANETGIGPEKIAISAGLSKHMTSPFGAMLSVEFLDKDVLPSDANIITEQAGKILNVLMSTELKQRAVVAYPSIRNTLLPVFAQ